MFFFIYDFPVWLFLVVFVGCFVVFAVVGLAFFRRMARRLFGPEPHWSDLVHLLFESCVAFYSLLLALLAVVTYQNYAHAEQTVTEEASALSVLYRDIAGFPPPYREPLRKELRNYTRYVVDEAWPEQRRGTVPMEGVSRTSKFQKMLFEVEPKTTQERLLQSTSIAQFNAFVAARRARLDAIPTHLPQILWIILVLGMLISIAVTWFLPVERTRPHAAVCVTYTIISSLVLSLVAAMDYPFRGALSVSPRPFELLLATVMASAG
ncbi:DUF4239 domain-containing protein [Streptomyces sp. 1222.5]|uniref:bestrophin-like domain n=1 Tax=Streptomyces sp. 1222.5 TaxID=1881026 RepID=UPI003D759DD2